MGETLATATRVPGLSLTLATDTEHATSYLRGRPFLSVQRERGRPGWRVYQLDGVCIGASYTAAGAVRAIEGAALADPVHHPACVVTLASDYQPRPMRLAMVRTVNRRAWTLAGYSGDHIFDRLSYLGGERPTFRRRADLAEWCALVGLVAAEPVTRGRRDCYLPHALAAASPVATVGGRA